ncbi:MAG: endonuclease/exonuclease/phosphatase family protein [Propionibacteriaceae bacterium]
MITHRRSKLLVPGLLAAALALSTLAATAAPADAGGGGRPGHRPDRDVRFATFNASLNRAAEGELVSGLSTPDDPQASAVAEIIQRADPDVLLINEFDFDAAGEAADLFRENYLEVSQHGADPVRYLYAFSAPSNTGVPSGHDLNNDGTVGGADDAFGFGDFEGQYGMLVLSKYPIQEEKVRTFQHFRWADMPDAKLPDDPATDEAADWYDEAELADLRLSSKSHWDVPIKVPGKQHGQWGGSDRGGDRHRGRTVHFLASHPTPPVFDGEEDRNGMRNSDEIRFWADYVGSKRDARYIYDDDGRRGGLDRRASFVIAGDLNSDPRDGDSLPGSADQLLDHRRVNTSVTPSSEGAVEATELQGGPNAEHRSNPRFDTADFAEPPGNIRADYVLPSRDLRITGAEVFWPESSDPLAELTGTYPFPSSDHRLVHVDVRD